MALSTDFTAQFGMLPKSAQEAIFADMTANDNPLPTMNMNVNGRAVTGPVFKGDAGKTDVTVGPLTAADLGAPQAVQRPQQQPGALSMAPMPRREPVDIASMLERFVPQDDSQAKYLALAAGFGSATKTGSFSEQIGNVASAMNEQKMQQAKLRSQYAPLIMQQVAAQQAREEQNIYRLEAQREAQAAAQQAAQQAQQGRADIQAENIRAANERAASDRASREQISQDRLAVTSSAEKLAGKAPQGYAWGPPAEDGSKTMVAVKGGPADLKQVGVLNADNQALTGAVSSFDRLAAAANQVLKHPGLAGITGLRGMIPNIPGADAADAQALLGTLKSQVGFGVLQDMRNNSKTGGALGSVSDQEGKRLESNLASLEKAQSLKQFQDSLIEIIDYAEKAKGRMREAYNLKHGGAGATAAPPTPSQPASPALPTADLIAAEVARRAAKKKD